MYIIKNALKCIGRSRGRNILIGIIALVIAVSACIGLSIRQAADSAKNATLEGMQITATISYDRQSMMNNMAGMDREDFDEGSFDKDAFMEMMGSASSLTLEEYEKYAEAKSVQDFYYTITAYFNASASISPVTNSSSSSSAPQMPGGMGGMDFGDMFSTGDFTVIGYSSDSAMTDFVSGDSSISKGFVFEEGTTELSCIISEELANYNILSVGDTITLLSTESEDEMYQLTIVGIYKSNSSNDFSMSMFGSSQDPANRIYMSAAALSALLDTSESTSGRLAATYVLKDIDAYNSFQEEVRELGLDDSYSVSSSDITEFENSLTPLKTLGTMAGWFLLVILAIGAVILVVLNIFNVRERKYEIGVLTAMGMKKWKVATQFIVETLIVTMIAFMLGAGIGAVSSVPVTNALLENQVNSRNFQKEQIDNNFGRPQGGFGGNIGGMPNFGGGFDPGSSDSQSQGKNPFENMFSSTADYITEIDSAMNLTVVFQMIGIGFLLTLVASMVAVLFVMRYDPLRILANRD